MIFRRRHRPHVEVLRLQPGDVLAVQLDPRGRADENLHWIRRKIVERLPDGVEVMVFEGTKLSVLRDGREV